MKNTIIAFMILSITLLIINGVYINAELGNTQSSDPNVHFETGGEGEDHWWIWFINPMLGVLDLVDLGVDIGGSGMDIGDVFGGIFGLDYKVIRDIPVFGLFIQTVLNVLGSAFWIATSIGIIRGVKII